MNIGIIGAGHVGRALADGFTRAGHSVTISSRNPEHAEAVAQEFGAKAVQTNREAVTDTDMVVLAVPALARHEVADELRDDLVGRTVIDVTNVINPDLTRVASDRSGAEDLQDMMPGAKVIKAFNTVMSSQQADPNVDGIQIDGFYAGDDEWAKHNVFTLMKDMGYRPIDAGPLAMARVLEDMALLNVRLNVINGWPWQTEWKLIGPMPGVM